MHLFLLACALSTISCATSSERPLLAVASNLSYVITEISARLELQEGIKPRLTIGSSGNFARQIIQGAPYDVFISADKKYIQMISDSGSAGQQSKILARGRLCAFLPNNSKFRHSLDIHEVMQGIMHGRFGRIAMANPKHAPYGVAARQALRSAGVWAIERDRLLLGENVAQAAQFGLVGGVDITFISCSFQHVTRFTNQGRFIKVPVSWHNAIEQSVALLHPDNREAAVVYRYFSSTEARRLLQKHGYLLPAEN